MPRHIREDYLRAIENLLPRHPDGITAQAIAAGLAGGLPLRTLQYRLKNLVDQKRIVRQGEGRWSKYSLAAETPAPRAAPAQEVLEPALPLSPPAQDIRNYVRQPLTARTPAGYNRAFLDSYRPNVSWYLTTDERAHLRQVATAGAGDQPAGTYAKQILNRLLIDLSYNSSRLEGNTYSRLDTRRLVLFGEEAAGKQRLDAQMILNHKDAIEFLVASAEDIGFNRYTILNLHALLANNLLDDPNAPGRLRHIAVGIEGSAYHPLEVPQLIEEYFDQILTTVRAIDDPFEQGLFLMVQLPYLQPFDDVNKRVSRLAANIPLIKANLVPLSFVDVPRPTYTEAILGVYELNRIDLLKDVFLWACERSAARYAAVRQSLGEPDPFRLRHRDALRQVVGEVVRGRMGRKAAIAHMALWAAQNIDTADREQFRDVVESELLGLHEGNFARYMIRPSEFAAWQHVWRS